MNAAKKHIQEVSSSRDMENLGIHQPTKNAVARTPQEPGIAGGRCPVFTNVVFMVLWYL